MIATTRIELPVDRRLAQLEANAYALDSTTIDLCLALFPWARFRRRKGGIKAHTLLDLRTGIPVFLRVSHAKTHDLWALDQLTIEPGAFYVFDKAYVDFARLWCLHTAGAFFVTRSKRKMDFTVRHRREVEGGSQIKSDRLIQLAGPKSQRLYPGLVRHIRYVDPDTGKRLKFLTNHASLAAATIALLYHQRWKIELFFKWIKQHLHIRAFFGNTPNAVKTQLWAAVIVYVLVIKLKHRYQLSQEPNEILQILSVTILEKTPVFELFSEIKRKTSGDQNANQLPLFE